MTPEEFQRRKLTGSFEYQLFESFQKKSNDPFIKNYDTEKMYHEYEYFLRMYWLTNKDKFSYEELKSLLNKEIEFYFRTEKDK